VNKMVANALDKSGLGQGLPPLHPNTDCTHHPNLLNSASMSYSLISDSTVSIIGSNPPYCWYTHDLALQYWVRHEALYSFKWLPLWKHTHTTFMISFIGPVYTAGVRKTNVLSVCQYMHLCTNDVIHLLFEAENFAHSFCIIKYICAGWFDFLKNFRDRSNPDLFRRYGFFSNLSSFCSEHI
jgi:hypothetical protein